MMYGIISWLSRGSAQQRATRWSALQHNPHKVIIMSATQHKCYTACEHALSPPLHPLQLLMLMPGLGPWGKDKYGGGLIKRVDALDFWTSRYCLATA